MHPTSIRLDPDLKRRLAARARDLGLSAGALSQRLIDEGLRTEAHPEIVFRQGPAGRRAGLAGGPDIAEVIEVIGHLEGEPEERINEAAAVLRLPERQIIAAVDYYGSFGDEIDAELEQRAAAAREERQRYERRQQLLSWASAGRDLPDDDRRHGWPESRSR